VIVRILTEGQFDVADEHLEALNAHDAELERAVESADDESFRVALTALLERVRALGSPLADDALEPSDLILPAADADRAEVAAMLTDEGLIPG
jgi:hypothetical protein